MLQPVIPPTSSNDRSNPTAGPPMTQEDLNVSGLLVNSSCGTGVRRPGSQDTRLLQGRTHARMVAV